MKNQLKNVMVLATICVVASLLLAVTNSLTADKIKQNSENAANSALVEVYPNGQGFEKFDTSAFSNIPEAVRGVFKESNGGYVFQVESSGYKPNMVIMCGIDASGKVVGAKYMSGGETNKAEQTLNTTVLNSTLETIDSVDTVAGSTLTSNGYKNAIKYALQAFAIFGGASVDTRDEATILNDNLKAALPAGNGEFEEVFITEKLENVTSVYSAKNGAGFVYVMGEIFVGIDNAGNVVSEADDATKALATSAFATLSSSKLTEINIAGLNLPQNIIKVSKTTTGNYLFELKASGFGIYGDEWYNPSGEYIYITLAATANKEIIAIKTTSQKETDGLGSVCGDAKFYNQFVGKDVNSYTQIDAISGATLTTDGYKTAVGNALKSIDTLKGVN